MAEAIDVITAERPLVLWLEDLHWSDVSTLELLALIARRREPARLLILGTYRPVDVIVTEHPLRAVKHELQLHGQCEELAVRLLSEEAIEEYLEVRFDKNTGTHPTTPLQGLAHSIHQRTEGNPLFMVKVVDDLLMQDKLDASTVEVSTPTSIRQMIEQQFERLSAEEQRVLEVASVAGVDFSAAAVAAGTETVLDEVEERCTLLVRRGQFLQAKGTTDWPDGTVTTHYGFLHALYQEVTYERASAGQRISLHQRIGERTETAYGERAREIAAELAVHFERGRVWEKAFAHLITAGQRAQQRYAHREALAYYDRALTISERLGEAVKPATLVTVYFGKWALHYFLGEFPFAIEAAEHALEAARQIGDRRQEADALYYTSLSLFNTHEFEKALEYAEQAKALAVAIGAKNSLAGSFLTMGLIHEVTGNLEESTRCYQESCQAGREAGNKRMEGYSLTWLGLLSNFVGEYEQALHFHEQAVSLGRTHDLQDGLVAFLWTKSIAHCGKGEYEAALASLQDAFELSERLGETVFKAKVFNTLGWVYGELYNLDLSLQYNQKGVELAYPSGDPERIRNSEINIGDTYLLLGDMKQAQHYLEKVYRDSQQRGKWGEEWLKWRYMQHCCHSLGELRLIQGNTNEAVALAEECLKLAEPTNSRKNIIKGWRLQGQALCAQGKLADAEATLQKALTMAKQVGNPPQLWKTYDALGEVYERQGATNQAQSAYAGAIEVIEQVASQLQDQELTHTFLSARPVQEMRAALHRVTESVKRRGKEKRQAQKASTRSGKRTRRR